MVSVSLKKRCITLHCIIDCGRSPLLRNTDRERSPITASGKRIPAHTSTIPIMYPTIESSRVAPAMAAICGPRQFHDEPEGGGKGMCQIYEPQLSATYRIEWKKKISVRVLEEVH
ncbi:hypothetical protein, unlikely [Trypanosoma brucei gambiense DAL972]|uniref:Uncharacterized protein n=1 Tax=Trypanosoma brucei gambiense (strain MHOM/CI/86/DAL972) TaxID=679716 RepID=D0AA29_TRYB9|nr:hypothetical protein, unlikely [Trypanosoma brucei gambiense DAL972]CBH18530.1 hypothetical protein, unlikely [Trypanosoma brucei gambiense DAL972]|eukprot:XP_011780794.1 hypothetical protein, unlikely [Trypanosoma brucei gambiense DAL972]